MIKNIIKARRSISKYYINPPTFLDGVASNFDLFNARRVRPKTSPHHDLIVMRCDFELVGKDLCAAIDEYKYKHNR